MVQLKRSDEEEFSEPNPMPFPDFGGGGSAYGGGGSYGMPGFFGNGLGWNGVYYDNISGTYRYTNGEEAYDYSYSVGSRMANYGMTYYGIGAQIAAAYIRAHPNYTVGDGIVTVNGAITGEFLYKGGSIFTIPDANGGGRDYITDYPTYYEKGIYSVDGSGFMFLPIKNPAAYLGGIAMHGRANVYLGKNGITYANVSATASTPSAGHGDVSFYGTVDVISGGDVVSTYQLRNTYTGPSIIAPGWSNVGSVVAPLPNYGGADVTLRLNIGYIYSAPEGRTTTWPATRSFYIPIPTY